MAAEGAAAGAVITGAELVATVGSAASAGAAAAPSVTAVGGAMAGDAALVLGASMRMIAHIGAYFGRDVRLPEEQVFALSVDQLVKLRLRSHQGSRVPTAVAGHPTTGARRDLGSAVRTRPGRCHREDLRQARLPADEGQTRPSESTGRHDEPADATPETETPETGVESWRPNWPDKTTLHGTTRAHADAFIATPSGAQAATRAAATVHTASIISAATTLGRAQERRKSRKSPRRQSY